MTQDEIVEMARQAGICSWLKPPEDVKERLEIFAKLVAAKELEACAKVADEHGFYGVSIAQDIRARGEA